VGVFAGVVVGLGPVVVEVPAPEVEEPVTEALVELEVEPPPEVVEEPETELLVELEPALEVEAVALEVEAVALEVEPPEAGRVEGTGAFAQPASIACAPAGVRVAPSEKPPEAPCAVQITGIRAEI